MSKVLKFSIDTINILEEISDEQLAIAEVWVCHNNNNLHNFPITIEALENAIPTLYNKFIVAGFKNGDFMGHEGKNQLILGFFPKENNVRFAEKDGKQYIVANAIISKVYAEWAYEILKKDNYRDVSMEIIVVDTLTIDDVDWINAFVFMGVTVLGLDWTPACPGSNVQITKFSTEEMIEIGEKAYHQYCVDNFSKSLIWDIPSDVKINAIKGLELKKQYEYGGNSVSMSFARFISKNDAIGESKVKNYLKYYPKTIKELSFSEPPDKEYINYMLLGGREGQVWMQEIESSILVKNTKINNYFETLEKSTSAIEFTVNKSNILSTTEWSRVDKVQLKKSVINAKNFEEIAPQVFMKLEDGWQEGIECAFGMPVMEKRGSELVYNKFALSNALDFAKDNKDDELMVKLTNIMQTLEMGKEEEKTEMVIKNVDFTELTYRNKMEIIDKFLHDENKCYYVSDISDDFVILYDWNECFYYKVPYSITGGDVILDIERKVAVVNAWTEDFSSNKNTEGERSMELDNKNIEDLENKAFAESEKKDDASDKKEEEMACNDKEAEMACNDKEDMGCDKKEEEMGCDKKEDAKSDEEEKMASDKKEDEKAEDAKADDAKAEDKKEEKMSAETPVLTNDELVQKNYALEQEVITLKESLDKLNEFKASIEKDKKDSIILNTLFDVQTKCPTMPQEEVDALKLSSESFALDKIEDWKNMVYSKAFIFSNGVSDNKTTFTKIGLPFEKESTNTKKSLWD